MCANKVGLLDARIQEFGFKAGVPRLGGAQPQSGSCRGRRHFGIPAHGKTRDRENLCVYMSLLPSLRNVIGTC
jgi:hypothetical protein